MGGQLVLVSTLGSIIFYLLFEIIHEIVKAYVDAEEKKGEEAT